MSRNTEKAPKFLIRSSAGKVNHLFSIEPRIFTRVLQLLEVTTSTNSKSSKKYDGDTSSLFGTVSADGCLQIWDLLKRRPIMTLDTHLPTTSWAEFCLQIPEDLESTSTSHNFKFYIHSRKSGLYCQNGEKLHKNSLVRLPVHDVHCGFCKPLLVSTSILVSPCGSDSITIISHVNSKKPIVEQVSTSGPVTFMQNVSGQSWVLVGTEDGKMNILDITTPKILTSYSLNKHAEDTSEGNLTPLCFDGDEMTGEYLVGTPMEQLVLMKLRISTEEVENETVSCGVNENELLSVTKVLKVHRRGTSCIKLHPNKFVIVVAGWDTRIRIFTFPDLKQLNTLACHSMTVSSLLFLPIPGTNESMAEADTSESDLDQETSDFSGFSTMTRTSKSKSIRVSGGYYMLSSSYDSTLAVWDDVCNKLEIDVKTKSQ